MSFFWIFIGSAPIENDDSHDKGEMHSNYFLQQKKTCNSVSTQIVPRMS